MTLLQSSHQVVDGANGTNLTKTPITRTTEPDGTVKDHVSMSESIAIDTVEKAKQQGVDTARIVIPDTNDKVSEVKVEIPKSALKQLNDGQCDHCDSNRIHRFI